GSGSLLLKFAKVLGKENAKLLYGQEEAILAYQAAVDDFLKTTARSLSLTVRQQQLQQFKQQYLAEYLPVLNSYQEKGFNRYLEDLALAELDSQNNEQLAAIRLKTRQYYFGEQKAQQMAQQDQTQAEQQQRMAQYQHAKQQLLTKYGNNSNDSQYLAQLQQLRQQLF
ncbi:MAG TPA: lipase secretion chaperone, partial [Agitococcus sp.]|nr:lipase secretion chaperone [Agitococcus sp.]